MAERPILFNGDMVRAILDGRKTETRRPVKGAPSEPRDALPMFTMVASPKSLEGTFSLHKKPYPPATVPLWRGRCQYGAPGDRLWVRETFAANVPGCERGLSYRADHIDPRGDGPASPMRWTPSIHMPRWASRITLAVKSVRIERLSAITEAGAKAEGFASRAELLATWAAIYGDVAADPWVWVVGSEREVTRG